MNRLLRFSLVFFLALMVLSVPANPLADISNNGAMASSHTPKIIEKDRGSHIWDLYGNGTRVFVAGGLAGTQVWDGNTWTDYILNDLGNNSYEVSTGLISTKFSGTETQHYSANMTSHVATEDYIIAESKGANWIEYNTSVLSRTSGITSEAKIKEIAGVDVIDSIESIRITENSSLDIGSLVTFYDFVESKPLKHTFTFTKETSGTNTYRFYHDFYPNVEEIELESISNDDTKQSFDKLKIKSGEIEFADKTTSTTITLDKATYGKYLQLVQFRNALSGELILGEIVAPDPSHPSWDDFIELQIDTTQNPPLFRFVYGDWILSQGQSFVLDPDTYSSNDPTVDGQIEDIDDDNICNTASNKVTNLVDIDVKTFRNAQLGDCARGFIEYDISAIDDGADVTNTVFKFEINNIDGSPRDCDFRDMGSTMPSTATDADIFSAIASGTLMVSNSECTTTGTNKSVDLGTNGDSGVEARLIADSFAIGIKVSDETQDTTNHDVEFSSEDDAGATPKPTLEVTYTVSCTPNAPTGLTATAQSTTQIDLSWTNSSNCTNSSVEIQRSTDGGAFSTIYNSTVKTSHSDTGLTANESYTYRVRIQSDTGDDSAWSSTASDETIPPQVTGLSATAQSTTQIDLSWDNVAGDDENGYKIEQNIDGAGWTTRVADTGTQTTTYSATGLTSNESYQYRVSAISDGGTGTASTASTEETIPSQVTGLTATAQSTTQIDLSWNNISGDDENGYKIEINVDGGGWTTEVANTGSQATTYSDTGLTSNESYQYRVSAISDGGTGTASTASTEETIPSQVTGLTATAQSTTQIDLSWNNISGDDENGYKIERRLCAGSWSTIVADTASQATTYTDSSLSSGTCYGYRVSAISDGGTGTASVEDTASTDGIPSAPLNPTLDSMGTHTGTLGWDTPSDADNLTGYRIYNATDNSIHVNDTATTDTTYNLTGLTSGKLQEFIIAGWNATGIGSNSTSVSNHTINTPATISVEIVNGTALNVVGTINGTFNGLKIERESPTGNGFSVVNSNTTSTNSTYTDAGLTSATEYNYQIYVHNLGGTSSVSNESVNATSGSLPVPTGVSCISDSLTQVTCTWDAPSSGTTTGYKIERKTTGDYSTIVEDTGDTSTTYTDTGLTGDIVYTYRVTALGFASDGSNDSSASDPDSVRTVEQLQGGGGVAGGGGQPVAPSPDTSDDLGISFVINKPSHVLNLGLDDSGVFNLSWNTDNIVTLVNVDAGIYQQWVDFGTIPTELNGDSRINTNLTIFQSDVITTAEIPYRVIIPPSPCIGEFDGSSYCADKQLHEIPITFTFDVEGTEVTRQSVLGVDLREPVIEPATVQNILLGVSLISVVVGGNFARQFIQKKLKHKGRKNSGGLGKSKYEKRLSKALTGK